MKNAVGIIGALLLAWAGAGFAQTSGNTGDKAGAAPEKFTLDGQSLTNSGPAGKAKIGKYLGQDALLLDSTVVMMDDVTFDEGVIEFDIAFDRGFGFGGVFWHAKSSSNYEYFYLRTHKSGQPDASQYSPVRDGDASWQIFVGPHGQQPMGFVHGGWNHVRLVVIGDRADIYLNGLRRPSLHIPDLLTDNGAGGVGFQTSGNTGEVRIANISIRGLKPGDTILGTKVQEEMPLGVIREWRVSTSLAEASFVDQFAFPTSVTGKVRWQNVKVESNGIADLSRVARFTPQTNTSMVSLHIASDRERRVRMNFGYSDKARIYLNGNQLFEGTAVWHSRDQQFLGTVSFDDAVILPLKQGDNHLQVAVTEGFGGWAWAGAIADRDGLRIVRPGLSE